MSVHNYQLYPIKNKHRYGTNSLMPGVSLQFHFKCHVHMFQMNAMERRDSYLTRIVTGMEIFYSSKYRLIKYFCMNRIQNVRSIEIEGKKIQNI